MTQPLNQSKQAQEDTGVFLFVGGPCDGDWNHIDTTSLAAIVPFKHENGEMEMARYRRVDAEIVGSDGNLHDAPTVFVYEGQHTPEQLVLALISGYRNPKGT